MSVVDNLQAQGQLQEIYKSMLVEQPTSEKQIVVEGKEVPSEPVEETEVAETSETESVVEEGSELEIPKVGSKFNEVMSKIFSGELSESEEGLEECYGDKDCKKCKKKKKGMYREMDEMEMDYEEEEEMVSIPKGLLRELVSYLGDDMGYEDESNVDAVDFEGVEEAYAAGDTKRDGTPSTVGDIIRKGQNQTGSRTVGKLGKKGGKAATYAGDRKKRDGKPTVVKDIIKGGQRQTGSRTVGSTKIGSSTLNESQKKNNSGL